MTATPTTPTESDGQLAQAETTAAKPMPPVLSRMLRGTFWLALRTPIQAVIAFWRVPLIIDSIGQGQYGAFGFAWGFGFLQFLFEFGMGAALQKVVSDRWTRGDHDGVNRSIACGTAFYSLAALAQSGVLIAIASFGIPSEFTPEERSLIVKLLWLQVVTSPSYGLIAVISSVLQAARRYEFIPRLEVPLVILQFAALWLGLKLQVDYFWICTIQVLLGIVMIQLPALWVMVRELGHRPHFGGASWDEFKELSKISVFVSIGQLSVILADMIDTTVLGYVLPDPAPQIAVYMTVSRPFLQIRQAGWMLAYLVMPAVASLAAAGDRRGLEMLKYDGARFHIAALMPIVLLAWIDAEPFLAAWVPKFADQSYLMRLFLVATTPLVVSLLGQIANGLGHMKTISMAALGGAIVNLPLSYALTLYTQDVSGVIWGTVLTTLVSNLLIPAVHCFRVLEIRPREFVRRTLLPPIVGGLTLTLGAWATWGLVAQVASTPGTRLQRATPLVMHLTLGVLCYLVGYLLVPAGRGDLNLLLRKLGLRRAPVEPAAPAEPATGSANATPTSDDQDDRELPPDPVPYDIR